MDILIAAGLGQDHGSMTLDRTTDAWLAAGVELRSNVARVLEGITAHVEIIGSSSVRGLLAKPIIDLAVGLAPDQELGPTSAMLRAHGWIYRGDAGDDNGGNVFVLETRPRYRVAHLHVVVHEGAAWRNYLRLRDVLRTNADAREQYAAVKADLAQMRPVDRHAYTVGKSEVVARLLENSD